MWIACLTLALQAAPAPPAFDASLALRLLQRSTSFTARTGRSRPEVRRIARIDESSVELGYFVETSWVADRDGSPTPATGVATVVPVEQLDPDARILGMEGVWALWQLDEKTWDDFQRELAESRARARDANVLGQLRWVLFAQMAFQGKAGAFAGEWRCLTRPAECIEGYEGESFLQTAPADTDGYRFVLRGKPGPTLKAGLVTGFVATAAPVAADTGKRSFCCDAQRMCVLASGTEVAGDAETCPESCTTLE